MKTREIMGRLRAACLPRLVAYESDLGHDATWLANNVGEHFIHTCRKTGTDIYKCPRGYGQNEREPFLFGHATPQQQAHSYRDCIKAQAADSIFHYFNGRRLMLVTPEAALIIYDKYVRQSDEYLRKYGKHEPFKRRAG